MLLLLLRIIMVVVAVAVVMVVVVVVVVMVFIMVMSVILVRLTRCWHCWCTGLGAAVVGEVTKVGGAKRQETVPFGNLLLAAVAHAGVADVSGYDGAQRRCVWLGHLHERRHRQRVGAVLVAAAVTITVAVVVVVVAVAVAAVARVLVHIAHGGVLEHNQPRGGVPRAAGRSLEGFHMHLARDAREADGPIHPWKAAVVHQTGVERRIAMGRAALVVAVRLDHDPSAGPVARVPLELWVSAGLHLSASSLAVGRSRHGKKQRLGRAVVTVVVNGIC
mmetsp:Transcript_12035/g.25308  ORF Transcript_12035/g.25308 Transcript_12035/m.25308 type:complete len:276 (-) Transcript_12035:426-1253(-)